MQVSVKGKQIDVGESLRGHVEAALGAIADRLAARAIEGHAVFSREAHLIRCEVAVHFGRDLVVHAEGDATDAYAAFDQALDRAGKRLRRYKRRLRDYHGRTRAAGEPPEMARSFVLAPVEEEAEEGSDFGAETDMAAEGGAAADGGIAPVVIAEMSTELPQLTVGEAVMRMDLADSAVLLFRNRSHGELNIVYRRGDGNIGWIDPANKGSGGNR